ncbi:MAG TPA: ATP-grasp domain-containing protein [Nannocystis exedens]|nr:ATP-grasp domain-containing protein [Nannocystis exedens]
MVSLNIGVLISQPAHEPSLDRASGEALAKALQSLGLRATLIPADDELRLAQALRQAQIDACLLATHGDLGGSGRLQSQLRRCCIPFVGPEAEAVAAAYDKGNARKQLQAANLPVPTTFAFGGGLETPSSCLAYLGWPAILKPRRGAQGRGVLRLLSAQEILDVVEDEVAHGREILVERAVEGVEVQVVLLDGEVLGSMQIERSRDLQTIEAMICPPELSPTVQCGIEHIARHAAQTLGLGRGVTRVDILRSDRHNEQILEVEPLPSLARDGVVARVAQAAGIDYTSLVAHLLAALPVVDTLPQVGAAPENQTHREHSAFESAPSELAALMP